MRVEQYEQATCPACGTEFMRLRGVSTPKKYCSRRCVPRERSYEQAVCEECGESFSRMARTTSPRRFCSKSCMEKARRRRQDAARPQSEAVDVPRTAFVFGSFGQYREADFGLGF